jgi:amino acid transporter
VSGVFVLFEVVVYAGLIAVMPRAGGDYVWETRVLGGGIGFTLAATGWIFILWLWLPIYAQIMSFMIIEPLSAVLADWTGNHTFVDWALNAGTQSGLMLVTVILAVFAAIVIGAGMRVYARVQKYCFYGAIAGLAIMFVMLLFGSHSSFVTGFNHYAKVLGVRGDAVAQTVAAGKKAGYTPTSFSTLAFGASWALVPYMLFWNLWPNWGASLCGEVRGASDFQRNLRAMGTALIVTTILALASLVLLAHVMTSDFYSQANYTYASGTNVLPIYPYPGLMAAMLTTNHLVQLVLILLLSLWFFGWGGTVFMSSTRVVFAAAFDRVFPEKLSEVSRSGAPLYALALMVVPGLFLGYLYSYNVHSFQTVTYDATLVIAVTFLGTTIAAILMPWRQKQAYDGSAVARYKIGGIPVLVVAGVIFAGFLIWNLWKWLSDSVYGLNSHTSLVFLGFLYVLAIVVYVGSRIVRSREGIDLSAVHHEIPVE